jgi:hypothetical protein
MNERLRFIEVVQEKYSGSNKREQDSQVVCEEVVRSHLVSKHNKHTNFFLMPNLVRESSDTNSLLHRQVSLSELFPHRHSSPHSSLLIALTALLTATQLSHHSSLVMAFSIAFSSQLSIVLSSSH